MTINQRKTWIGAKVYMNPQSIDTPQETKPENAEGAVNHLSKRVTLRKYKAPEGWQCNGLALAGEPELLDFWCVIKPVSKAQMESTKLDMGGEVSEGAWLLYYNPFHPKHPEEGIRLQLSDDDSDYTGFADVIEYDGKLWIVRKHLPLDIDYGESYERFIGKAIIERWAEPTRTISASAGHYELQ